MDVIGTSSAPSLRVSAFAALAQRFARAFEMPVQQTPLADVFWSAALGDDTAAFDRAVSDPMVLMTACRDPERSPWAVLARRAAEFEAPEATRSAVLDRLLALADLDAPLPAHHFPNSGERAQRLGRNPRLLHWACSEGLDGLAKALIKAGANPDGVSTPSPALGPVSTVSPVCLAFESDNMVLAGYLLDAGASAHAEHVDNPEKSFKNIGQAIFGRARKALGQTQDRQERALHWIYWADERQISPSSRLMHGSRPASDSPLDLAIAARQALSALDSHLESRAKGVDNPLSALHTLKEALLLKPERDKLPSFFFAALAERSEEKIRSWTAQSEDRGNPVGAIDEISVLAWVGFLGARDVLCKPLDQSCEEAMAPSLEVLGFLRAHGVSVEALSPALGSARSALASLMPPDAFALWEREVEALGFFCVDESDDPAVPPEQFAALREQFDLSRIMRPAQAAALSASSPSAHLRGRRL